MNEEIIKNILSVIKRSTDRNVTLKALVKLRTDVVTSKEGIILFQNCSGAISTLVRLLQKPHEKILETVLSILGNCCTDKECCRECIVNKITNPLVSILKSIPNPLIQCRACRLLGNLAKDTKSISSLSEHNKSFAQALCMILEEAIEPQTPTRIMAVRAMRFLLSDAEFQLHLIKSNGLKILISLLTKLTKNSNVPIEVPEEKVENRSEGLKKSQHREKYFEEVARHLEGVRSDIFDATVSKEQKSNDFIMPNDKESADLVVEILKCLHVLSEIPSNTLGSELLQINDLRAVVHLANGKNRPMALRTLSNFSKSPAAFVALSISGSITTACELLTDTDLETPLTENEIKHCINIVYMLGGDACNRAKVRRSGTLAKLLEIAKNSESQTQISMILCVLNYFQYDSMSMNLMLRDGLLGLLIKELDAYINSEDEYRKKRCEEKVSRKRKIVDQNTSTSTYKAQKINEDCLDLDSPGSSPKGMTPSSPCSSRSMSPNNLYLGFDKDIDSCSDTYSPVCSEDEGIDDDEEKMDIVNPESSDFDIMKLLDTSTKSDPQGDESNFEPEEDENYDGNASAKRSSSVNLPCNAINIIENLIFRVTLMVNKRGELGKKQTLSTIIHAITVFGSTTPLCGSLANIFSESQFFAPIIKQQIVYEVYKMSTIDEVREAAIGLIDTLTCVAESGYGRGEIVRLLQCDDITQTRTSIAISFIIKSTKLLYQFLTEGGSLYILIKSILNKNDEHRNEAADAISVMSRALGIRLPIYSLHTFETMTEFDESTHFTSVDNTEEKMKFIVHRGCSKIPIEFNKKLLMENSEVFNSMLNSNFREGNEGEIQLKNSSVYGIKYFLNLVDILANNKKPNIPPIYHFDAILEAYELSKLYFFDEMEEILLHMLVYRLDSNNCLNVLEWAIKNCDQHLSEIVINYYLCSDLSSSEKIIMFRTADYSELSTEWNQMIVDAVLVKCQNLSYDNNL